MKNNKQIYIYKSDKYKNKFVLTIIIICLLKFDILFKYNK